MRISYEKQTYNSTLVSCTLDLDRPQPFYSPFIVVFGLQSTHSVVAFGRLWQYAVFSNLCPIALLKAMYPYRYIVKDASIYLERREWMYFVST